MFSIPGGSPSSIFDPVFTNTGLLTWKNETSQNICYLTLFPAAAPFEGYLVDNISAKISCEPTIECITLPVAEVCENEAANVAFQICVPDIPQCIDFTTITHTLTLPSGWTLVGNDPEPFNLTEGQCEDINLQVQMPAGTPVGTTVSIVLSGTASGLCTEVEWSCEAEVEVVQCSEFACPCTGPNDLNIDAGDVSTNPNDPNITPVSILATDIPANIVTLGGVPTLMKPCIAIKGNLLIDNNFNLFIFGGEIRMQPGSKIIVAPGSTLRLFLVNQGTGTERGIHGCEQMWRSIEVQPGGNLYTAFNVIQDAEFAFDLRGTGAAPASFNCNQNDFDRNHVGIRVNNSAFAALNQPTPAVRNRFRANSSLLPNFSSDIVNWNATAPYSGVMLANTTFFLGTPADNTSVNEFNGLRNGILADRSTLDVHHARFLNTQGVLPYYLSNPNFVNSQGIGIFARNCGHFNVRNSLFDEAPRAIHAAQSSLDIRTSVIQNVDAGIVCLPASLNRITIADNEVFFKGRGMVVEGGGAFTRVNIDRNDPITCVPSNISQPTAIQLGLSTATSTQIKHVTNNNIILHAPDPKGIDVGATGGWWIHNNTIQFTAPDFSINGGIELNNADNNNLRENTIFSNGSAGTNGKVGVLVFGSENNKICCNTTNNLRAGFEFYGVSDDTKLRYSDIGNHVFGLRCGFPVQPGQQPPTAIIGDQIHAGNNWNGTYDFRGAAHYGDVASINGSEFFVQLPQALPLWPTNSVSLTNPFSPAKPGQWFLSSLGSATNCSVDIAECPPLPLLPPEDTDPDDTFRDLTNNELAIARGEYGGTGTYGLAAQFEGERSLYGKMMRNSTLHEQDTLVDQFFGNAAIGTIGALYNVDYLTSQLGSLSSTDWATVLYVEQITDSLMNEAHRIDSLYGYATTAQDSLDLQSQKHFLIAQIQPLQEAWQHLADSISMGQVSMAASIAAQNAGIGTTNLLTANRKTVNRIWLETIASGRYEASQGQLDDLLSVAEQCFLEGGDAVLQARILYRSLAQPLSLDDISICGGEIEERNQRDLAFRSAFFVKVVPNPAKDRFSIQASGVPANAVLRVQITDLNGRVLKDTRVQNGEILAYAFSPGLYLCRVSTGDGPAAQVVKFVILP